MLAEAAAHGAPIEAVFLTAQAYEESSVARELDAASTPVFIVNDATIAKLSDVETPAGIVAVCVAAPAPLDEFFAQNGMVLVLAGITDPGNAGTLVRSADAFGVDRILFGSGSVEAYNPKVVRASMGSLFRVRISQGSPAQVAAAAQGWEFVGLAAGGGPLEGLAGGPKRGLVVGHERRGLGPWEPLCARSVSIPMRGQAESLNAGVAGSIALFEATRGSK